MVVWRGTFWAQSAQLAPAYAELDKSVTLVRDYLRARGIADTSMVVSSIQTRTFYEIGMRGIETANVSGYRLTQGVEVPSRDVERIGALARQSTERPPFRPRSPITASTTPRRCSRTSPRW